MGVITLSQSSLHNLVALDSVGFTSRHHSNYQLLFSKWKILYCLLIVACRQNVKNIIKILKMKQIGKRTVNGQVPTGTQVLDPTTSISNSLPRCDCHNEGIIRPINVQCLRLTKFQISKMVFLRARHCSSHLDAS